MSDLTLLGSRFCLIYCVRRCTIVYISMMTSAAKRAAPLGFCPSDNLRAQSCNLRGGSGAVPATLETCSTLHATLHPRCCRWRDPGAGVAWQVHSPCIYGTSYQVLNVQCCGQWPRGGSPALRGTCQTLRHPSARAVKRLDSPETCERGTVGQGD